MIASAAPEPRTRPRTLALVFAAALAVRLLYDFALYLGFGAPGLLGPDSTGYLVLGRTFAAALAAGTIEGWALLGPDLSLMPLFTWALTFVVWAGGDAAPLIFASGQALLDAGTCACVAAIAAQFSPRLAIWAGLAAALTPTSIVVAGLVYTDTPFVFFATFALYAALRWLESPRWRWALLLGVALGLAALTRALIVLWVPPLMIFLALVLLLRRSFGRGALAQLATVGALFALFLAPVVARNVAQYGAWAVTAQGGNHLSHWVLPLVKEGVDGTPREKTNAATNQALAARFKDYPTANPFANAAMMSAYAREELGRLGWSAIARAWAIGAAINLASPAVVHIPPVSNLPRTGFYDTPGATFTEKAGNFLFGSGNLLYSRLLVAGLLGVAAIRIVQLIGLIALFRRRGNIAGILLLAGWCLYILAVNGPIASPKYRLPLEPPLAVLSGAGLAALAGRRRRGASGQSDAHRPEILRHHLPHQ